MDPNNSETQDNVDTATTENNSADSQEHEEQQQGQQAEQSQEGEGGEQSKPEEEAKPKKNRAQERIQQLAREKAEMAAKLAEYEQKQNAPAPAARPKVEDFESYNEFQEALEVYQIEQAEKRVLEKLQKEQAQKSQVEQQAAYESALAELQDEGVDVQSLMQKAESLPSLPVTLDQFGLSTKETLSLAADLLGNEDLYHELASMNPYQAAMKIGQIIGSKTSKPAAPKVQNAPKPINPVQANAPAKRSAESMSDNEFLKSRGL